jgi:signal transduction histidine kinase
VKNACEALDAHGCVVVSATREGGHAVLRVTDDGPGIAPEVRDSLFRPGISTKTEGSGLGLAVVQRIASDHRGTLRCSNLPIGAEFALEIPNDLEEDE